MKTFEDILKMQNSENEGIISDIDVLNALMSQNRYFEGVLGEVQNTGGK